MNHLRHALVVASFAAASLAQADEQLAPLLPLEADLAVVPFLDEAFAQSKKELAAVGSVKELAKAQKALLKSMKGAKAARKVEILERVVPIAGLLADHHARAAKVAGASLKTQDKGETARHRLEELTRVYFDGAPDGAAKADVAYQLVVLGLFNADVASAKTTAVLAANAQHLPAEKADTAKLAIAMSTGNEAQLKALFEQHDSALGRAAGFALLKKTKAPAAMAMIAGQATKLTADQQEAILAYLFTTWRASVPATTTWAKAPFDVAPFAATKAVAAYNERWALEDWRASRADQAIQRYMDLAKTHRGTATFVALGGRALALLEGRYAKTKNAAQHETGILALRERYADESATGKKGDKNLGLLQAALAQRHGKFVDDIAAAARAAGAKPDQRRAAIAMVTRYLALPIDAGRREFSLEGLAGLYAADGNLKVAVATYQRVLADYPKSEGRNRQLMAAVELQKKVATWPNDKVWFARPAGDAKERETLVVLLASLNKVRGDVVDWSVVSHLGQLERTLGRPEKSFALWQAALAKAPAGVDAAEAAGLMMTTYNKGLQWGSVEALARLSIKAKLEAKVEGKPVNSVALLGDALLNGGRVLYKSARYSEAASKLNEYARSYTDGKDRDEALYLLADAQRRVKQAPEALETYIVLLKDHPKSRFFRGAALIGGDLAVTLNHSGTALDLFDIFLRGYTADPEAPRVRDAAIALSAGKKRYLEVMNLSKDQIASKTATQALKERAARSWLKTAEEFSTPETTMAAANTIIAANLGAVRTGEAHAALARMFAAKRNMSELVKLEGKLATLAVGDTTPAVREALGQTRFVIADMKSGDDAANAVKKINGANGLGVERGTEYLGVNALKFTSEALARMTVEYGKACEEPAAGFCTTAMKRLAGLARGFVPSVTNLKMSEGFANEQIAAQFEAAKKALLSELTKAEVAAKAKTSADTAQAP